MASNKAAETVIYDAIQSSQAGTVKPTSAYTALPTDNVIICGANSVAVTLDANSNSPVYVTSIDATTQRTGCTIVANGNTYKVEDGAPSAHCIRVAGASLWMIIGAKSIS